MITEEIKTTIREDDSGEKIFIEEKPSGKSW